MNNNYYEDVFPREQKENKTVEHMNDKFKALFGDIIDRLPNQEIPAALREQAE